MKGFKGAKPNVDGCAPKGDRVRGKAALLHLRTVAASLMRQIYE
jgi:hypothetical protein